ncbi:hypothetical protein SDJN03_12825, partial [Cucurbita argyrosperma subsp. sororia]
MIFPSCSTWFIRAHYFWYRRTQTIHPLFSLHCSEMHEAKEITLNIRHTNSNGEWRRGIRNVPKISRAIELVIGIRLNVEVVRYAALRYLSELLPLPEINLSVEEAGFWFLNT